MDEFRKFRFESSVPVVALVTGASRGLGLGIVKTLHWLGYTVIATCRRPEAAAELNSYAEEAIAGGAKVHVFQMDVSSSSSVTA